MSKPNPFEHYDIDPLEGPEAITKRMRELIEQVDDSGRDELRAVWEQLTLHPRARLRVALAAFPETREPIGAPPSAQTRAPAPDPVTEFTIELADVALAPSVAGVLSQAAVGLPSALPDWRDDPILRYEDP